MQINPEKLSMLAAEWDPTPFAQAIESASAIPLNPAVPPVDQGDFSWVGNPGAKPQVPPSMGMPPAQMQSLMGMMQQKPAQVPQAPAVQPQAPQSVGQFPGMPKIGKIPTLAEILQGRSA